MNNASDEIRQAYLKEIEKQKEVLAEDDIIDSSSDDEIEDCASGNGVTIQHNSQKIGTTMMTTQTSSSTSSSTSFPVTSRSNNIARSGTQYSSKSEIIVIDSD